MPSQTYAWVFRFGLLRPSVRLLYCVHTHAQWPTWHEDTRKYGILRFLHELWDSVIYFTVKYMGDNLVCAISPTPSKEFVHTHTKWPTWHKDAASFTWVMGLCEFICASPNTKVSWSIIPWAESINLIYRSPSSSIDSVMTHLTTIVCLREQPGHVAWWFHHHHNSNILQKVVPDWPTTNRLWTHQHI